MSVENLHFSELYVFYISICIQSFKYNETNETHAPAFLSHDNSSVARVRSEGLCTRTHLSLTRLCCLFRQFWNILEQVELRALTANSALGSLELLLGLI